MSELSLSFFIAIGASGGKDITDMVTLLHLLPKPVYAVVDTLFNSVAAFSPNRAIGILLSGSLDDGSRGLAAVHAASRVTMVLDPCGKWPPGMQQNAVQHDGSVDLVGTAHMIAEMVGRVTTEAGHL